MFIMDACGGEKVKLLPGLGLNAGLDFAREGPK